jgi:hypothetical protein
MMSKPETDKTKAEQTNQINLADLPIDEARQDEVKGGTPLTYKLVYNRAS